MNRQDHPLTISADTSSIELTNTVQRDSRTRDCCALPLGVLLNRRLPLTPQFHQTRPIVRIYINSSISGMPPRTAHEAAIWPRLLRPRLTVTPPPVVEASLAVTVLLGDALKSILARGEVPGTAQSPASQPEGFQDESPLDAG